MLVVIEFQHGKHLDSKIKRGDCIRLKGLFNKKYMYWHQEKMEMRKMTKNTDQYQGN